MMLPKWHVMIARGRSRRIMIACASQLQASEVAAEERNNIVFQGYLQGCFQLCQSCLIVVVSYICVINHLGGTCGPRYPNVRPSYA